AFLHVADLANTGPAPSLAAGLAVDGPSGRRLGRAVPGTLLTVSRRKQAAGDERLHGAINRLSSSEHFCGYRDPEIASLRNRNILLGRECIPCVARANARTCVALQPARGSPI